MGVHDSAPASNPFASASDDVASRRSQVAQFALYRAAQKLSERNEEEAIRGFKTVLAFDPQNETAHTYLGKIYQSQEKLAEAIGEFKKVVELNGLSVEARNNLANAYVRKKEYSLAEEQFLRERNGVPRSRRPALRRERGVLGHGRGSPSPTPRAWAGSVPRSPRTPASWTSTRGGPVSSPSSRTAPPCSGWVTSAPTRRCR